MGLIKESKKNWISVKCPYCGREYHISELFMPDDLTGKPDVVIKDPLGKILYVDYKKDCEPVNTTTYECDNCFKEFTVKAQITLTAEPVSEEKDFSTEYTSLI